MRNRIRSPPPRHRSRDRRSRERHRRGVDESRERRRDYERDLGQRDTASMKFHWNHLLDRSERVGEDIDTRPWKTSSNPKAGLPQKDSPFVMYQEKHGLGENERLIKNGAIEGNIGRNYPDSRFEGAYKTVYSEKVLPFANYNPQSGSKRSYQDVASGSGYSPLKRLGKNEELHRRDDYIYGDKPKMYTREEEVSRFYSKDENPQLYSSEEESVRLYSRGDKTQVCSREEKPYAAYYKERESHFPFEDSHHKASVSDPFGNSYRDSRLIVSDGYNRSSRYLTEPYPVENTKMLMENATNYRKDKLSLNVGSDIAYGYSTAQKNDYTELGPIPDKPYGPLSFAKDEYRHLDPLGSRAIDPILSGYTSRGERLTEEKLRDNRQSPMERIASSYLDASRSAYAIGKNVEGLSRRGVDLGYGGGVYRRNEDTSSRQDYGYGRDEGPKPFDERKSSYSRENYDYGRDLSPRKERANSYVSKDYDRIKDRVDHRFDRDSYNARKGVDLEDVGMTRRSKDIPKRRRDMRERLGIKRDFSSKARDNRPNKSTLRSSRLRNPWVSNEIARRPGSSVGKARTLNRVRDIKKRLGPARPVDDNVKSSIKKQKNRKLLGKTEDGDVSVKGGEEGPSGNGVEMVKSEPPEKSEEFKQLVRSAFFKFVKQLNENTKELGKFKEQGKSGGLKCWVCGSSSEEFSDTESLIKHACTATKVGFRAQHLGFHRALCALLGWKAAETHKDEWAREILSVREKNSLKEDLILWPPLVVVHNSSIKKKNSDGRVAVSVEDLQTMIKDMGFGEKTKVCRGRPMNQSIMLVKFSATYSGFQEAERLHKFFADQKHGRTQYLKAQSKNPVDNNDTQKTSANNMKDVLYGFLGIGNDINKLDLETKKRCVVRSKKEIQDLGDAPLQAK